MAFVDVRKARLKADYEQIKNMVGPVLSFRILSGEAPYVDAYEFTINLRTIINNIPEYRNVSKVKIVLPEKYPMSRPRATMITAPAPYHPNWWTSGDYDCGCWNPANKLGDYLILLMRTLQYDKDATYALSPSNNEAAEWYKTNSERGLFPCDRTQLPDPTKR